MNKCNKIQFYIRLNVIGNTFLQRENVIGYTFKINYRMNSISKFWVSFVYKLKFRNLAQKNIREGDMKIIGYTIGLGRKTKLQFGYDIISITVVLAICCYLLLSQLLKEKLHSEE